MAVWRAVARFDHVTMWRLRGGVSQVCEAGAYVVIGDGEFKGGTKQKKRSTHSGNAVPEGGDRESRLYVPLLWGSIQPCSPLSRAMTSDPTSYGQRRRVHHAEKTTSAPRRQRQQRGAAGRWSTAGHPCTTIVCRVVRVRAGGPFHRAVDLRARVSVLARRRERRRISFTHPHRPALTRSLHQPAYLARSVDGHRWHLAFGVVEKRRTARAGATRSRDRRK